MTRILFAEIGFKNKSILCAALLHDTIEDGGLTEDYLREEFGINVASMVKQLTRDCDRKEYRERIRHANYGVRIIKLADVVHNSSDIGKPHVPDNTRENLVEDCEMLYLGMAKDICPELYSKLEKNLEPWL